MKLRLFSSLLLVMSLGFSVAAENLVIIHTNDTHSQIDPNENGLGGIARRKVVIDSVRAVHPDMMLIDAGDAVQGTLYFSLFGGEVERRMMNELGYDIQILGNHEFDNGMEALADLYKGVKADKLSSNYRLEGSTLQGLFKPYVVRKVGNRKVGFIAINLIPKGMIADKNCDGVVWTDGLKAANAYAWILKNIEGCDAVVAVTHVGYANEPGYSDVDLARGSHDIDVIIGGHSHTTINPDDPKSLAWRVPNADDRGVLIAQTGKGGQYVGEIVIDMDGNAPAKTRSHLIRIDSRLDNRVDPKIVAELTPYRLKVDSVMNIPIGFAASEFKRDMPELENLMADIMMQLGTNLINRRPDLAIINNGGLRTSLSQGTITKGEIIQIMPFDNRAVVIEIKGSDLLDALKVMGSRNGDGVSANVKVTYSKADNSILSATINGKAISPDTVYALATIDYLSNGGDYMAPLKNGKLIAVSENVLYDDVINMLQHGKLKGKKLKADNRNRWTLK